MSRVDAPGSQQQIEEAAEAAGESKPLTKGSSRLGRLLPFADGLLTHQSRRCTASIQQVVCAGRTRSLRLR